MKFGFMSFPKLLARRIVGQPILGRSILLYHRIADEKFDPFNLAVSPEEFYRQLSKLRRKTVFPLTEFARLHTQRKLPRDAVAITFDDGYACNTLVAAPMLRSFGYPATFFVVADAIKRDEEFWWDQLEVIVHAPDFNWHAAVRLLCNRLGNGLSNIVPEDSRPLTNYLALWKLVHGLSTDGRRLFIDELRQDMDLKDAPRPSHRPMTKPELRALGTNTLFEIGGHTATHPSLPTLAPAEQEREIVFGSRVLEAATGKPVRTFSYPFGDWDETTRDTVVAAGFECAVAGQHRKVRSNDDQFSLPRRLVLNRYAHTA
jgi:peptidoglycan/xylan/chitin deacetylase (PgdA/CDA1 family)